MGLEDEFRFRNKGETKALIADKKDEFTDVERNIADFFLNNEEIKDFSSKAVAGELFVSEAALSRFAKKCGYKGFRELVFAYENDLKEYLGLSEKSRDISIYSKSVKAMYTDILLKSFEVLDEKKMERIAEALVQTEGNVFVFGIGSSGFAAEEFTYRFMRLGLNIQAVTDSHVMKMSAALAKKDTIVIGITVSGNTREISDALKIAKKNGAKVFLFTGNTDSDNDLNYDERVLLSYIKDLDNGTRISPQISPLIMIDILYAYYMSKNSSLHFENYNETLSAITMN